MLLLFFLLCLPLYASAQTVVKLPIIKSNTNVISIKDGEQLQKDSWTLSPETKPDVYKTSVEQGHKKKITFMTDIDSISFDVEAGKKYDFIIQQGAALCYTQIEANELFFWSKPEFWQSPALKTPYQMNISDAEKIAGLSKFWSEAKYNFINFPLVPDLDWDKTYLDFIPKVLATKSTLEYYRVLQMFCAQLKDGHTNVFLPTQLTPETMGKPAIATRLIENRVIIFRILDEKLSAEGIFPGQEIIEIDGVPVRQYAAENVSPFASDSTSQSFDVTVYQTNLLTGAVANPVTLTLKDTQGNPFKILLPRLSVSARNKLAGRQAPFDMTILPDNIAYVKINSMVSGDKADQLFADNFSTIAQSAALILDLRDNGGGDSGVGYKILAFLTDKPFKGSSWYTRNYRPSFRAWGRPQEKFSEAASEISVKQLQQLRGDNTKVYDRPVVVLTSPRTFSAAEDFLVAFKPLKRGLIIGEPSGGSTGQPLFFLLPGGGSARVCTKHDSFADGTEFVGVGVIPDLIAQPKISDLTKNRDFVLELALSEIKKK